MLKRLFFLFFFSSLFCTAFSQTMPLTADNPIAIAAPHLPLMIRYDGVGRVFYGENTTYKFEINDSNLRTWIKNYPDELVTYKDAASKYLKTAESTLLTAGNKELYQDLKSQYSMIIQF